MTTYMQERELVHKQCNHDHVPGRMYCVGVDFHKLHEAIHICIVQLMHQVGHVQEHTRKKDFHQPMTH